MSRVLSPWQAILLAILVLLGGGLAGAGLFAIGNRQFLWSDTFQVTVGFPEIRGVEFGTRVRIQGMEAGEVIAIDPPAAPGDEVVLRLRLTGRYRGLLREDATVQIVSEGMIGGKAIEVFPGTSASPAAQHNARLAARRSPELSDMLGQVNQTLEKIREGQGTVGKLLGDPEAYEQLVSLLRQSRDAMNSVQQNSDAIKRLPIIRSYVEDAHALLVRPNCERNRQCYADSELFEPNRAVLTRHGRYKLDTLAPWLAGLKHKGSEIVVVAYADPRHGTPEFARTLTRQRSDAVCTYLKNQHAVQKMGWFSSRTVAALGMGTTGPPVPERDPLPADRVEVLVFVPQK